jgi:sterol desaturase/sphingolipid hydroxylase (fatty acid hydroxylase superfamily)
MDQLSYLDQIKFWLVAQVPQVDQYPQIARTLLQILHAGAWLVILAVIFIPLERLFALRPKKIFRKAVVTDVGYYFLNSLLPAFLLGFPLAAVALGTRHFEPAGFLRLMAGLPLWARLSGAAVVGEIGFYWGHRWSHEIPLLWRFHAVHHSAEDVDFLVSSRGHPVDLVFTRMCEMTPMFVLGLVGPTNLSGTAIPLMLMIFGTMWGFFIHANVKWRFGPLEWLISTPAFHHWHHTNDGPAYINKNYAPVLPWVDKMFGTLYLPKDKQPARYGIDQPISPVLFGQLVEPFMFWRKDLPVLVSVPLTGEAGETAAPEAEALLLAKTDV